MTPDGRLSSVTVVITKVWTWFMYLMSKWRYTAMIQDKFWLIPRDGVIKCKHFPRYWPFVRGIHRSTVNSPHKRQWRGALMFSLIWAWINGWLHNREAGDLRHNRAHYDVTVMVIFHMTNKSSPYVTVLFGLIINGKMSIALWAARYLSLPTWPSFKKL